MLVFVYLADTGLFWVSHAFQLSLSFVPGVCVYILRACILFTIDSGVFLCFAWFLFLSLYRYMHPFSGGSMEMLTFSLPLNMGILHQDSICMILFCFLVMMVCKL